MFKHILLLLPKIWQCVFLPNVYFLQWRTLANLITNNSFHKVFLICRKLNNLTHANFDRVITIQGSLENIGKAEKIISKKLRDGYRIYLPATSPPMMFPEHHQINDNYYPPPLPPPYGMYGNIQMPYNAPMMAPFPITQRVQEIVHVYIPTSAVGAIIGPGGSTVRDMMCSSGADIRVSIIPFIYFKIILVAHFLLQFCNVLRQFDYMHLTHTKKIA